MTPVRFLKASDPMATIVHSAPPASATGRERSRNPSEPADETPESVRLAPDAVHESTHGVAPAATPVSVSVRAPGS